LFRLSAASQAGVGRRRATQSLAWLALKSTKNLQTTCTVDNVGIAHQSIILSTTCTVDHRVHAP
jgi:hypothetical protein